MNSIAALPSEERREIVLQTSARTGMSPAIIEKDFWVCFYHAGWADYPNAVPGRMHLMPKGHILEGLTRDYAKMQVTMLPDDAPALIDILQELQRLENEVNSLTPLALDIRNYPDMHP